MDKNMGKRLCRRKTEGWDRDVGLEWLGDTANSRNCLKANKINYVVVTTNQKALSFLQKGF